MLPSKKSPFVPLCKRGITPHRRFPPLQKGGFRGIFKAMFGILPSIICIFKHPLFSKEGKQPNTAQFAGSSFRSMEQEL